jgi:hypothetical protein
VWKFFERSGELPVPKNVYDQASRYTAKLDPAGFLGWTLNLPADGFAYRGWLDTRGVPFPGGEERTGDTVARVDNSTTHGTPWIVAVEFQIEPDSLMFGRLLNYLSGLWLAVKPDPERGSRFSVGGVVVNLTGAGSASRDFAWPSAGLRTQLTIVERNLEREPAADLLGRIGTGERPRTLLPWIPLMTGADESAIVDRWKEEAEAEPDDRHRSDYAGLAKVFAEAAGRLDFWSDALKGWNMKQSQAVLEWLEEGRAEGRAEAELTTRRASLSELLEARFGAVPTEVTDHIRVSTDIATLKRWLVAAGQANSLAEFRAAIGV